MMVITIIIIVIVIPVVDLIIVGWITTHIVIALSQIGG